jgi:hypothetical protein
MKMKNVVYQTAQDKAVLTDWRVMNCAPSNRVSWIGKRPKGRKKRKVAFMHQNDIEGS